MSDNVDVPCEMCGRYGCDPKHHEPMSDAEVERAKRGMTRRALLARQERYTAAVYGDGRPVTERVRAIMAIADAEVRAAMSIAASWDSSSVPARRLTVDAVKDALLIADLQTKLADANATIARVQSLIGDTAGPLWSVRGVCEANLQAALNRRAW